MPRPNLPSPSSDRQVLHQWWLNRNAPLSQKLIILLFLGLGGIYMSIIGIEHKQNSIVRSSNNTNNTVLGFFCFNGSTSLNSDIVWHYPKPLTYDRKECICSPVHYFVVLSMQRTGSGWFESLLNHHPNISSHGEIFSVESRRQNFSTIKAALDVVYNLDWVSSAAKNDCTSAVGFKWMLNQGVMEYNREVSMYFKRRSVSVIFLFRRNILKRYVSLLANTFDRDKKLLNGTHKAHVHTKEEADLLASFKPVVNVTGLLNYLDRVKAVMDDSLLFFNTTNHLVLYYEDLIRNSELMYRVQDFLRVPPSNLQSRHVKIHTKPLAEQIENSRELFEKIKGTNYETYLKNRDYT